VRPVDSLHRHIVSQDGETVSMTWRET
jgi:hypothetical protein